MSVCVSICVPVCDLYVCLSVFVCLLVCVCMYAYLCLYACLSVFVCVSACVCMCARLFVCTFMSVVFLFCAYVSWCLSMIVCLCLYSCMLACTFVCRLFACLCLMRKNRIPLAHLPAGTVCKGNVLYTRDRQAVSYLTTLPSAKQLDKFTHVLGNYLHRLFELPHHQKLKTRHEYSIGCLKGEVVKQLLYSELMLS